MNLIYSKVLFGSESSKPPSPCITILPEHFLHHPHVLLPISFLLVFSQTARSPLCLHEEPESEQLQKHPRSLTRIPLLRLRNRAPESIKQLVGALILSAKTIRGRLPEQHFDDAVERSIRGAGDELLVYDGVDIGRCSGGRDYVVKFHIGVDGHYRVILNGCGDIVHSTFCKVRKGRQESCPGLINALLLLKGVEAAADVDAEIIAD